MSDLERKEFKRKQDNDLKRSLITLIFLSVAMTSANIGMIVLSLSVMSQRSNTSIGGEIFLLPILFISFWLGVELRKNYEITRK